MRSAGRLSFSDAPRQEGRKKPCRSPPRFLPGDMDLTALLEGTARVPARPPLNAPRVNTALQVSPQFTPVPMVISLLSMPARTICHFDGAKRPRNLWTMRKISPFIRNDASWLTALWPFSLPSPPASGEREGMGPRLFVAHGSGMSPRLMSFPVVSSRVNDLALLPIWISRSNRPSFSPSNQKSP